MRISRSGGSASFPPLDSPLPMEKSWALEVEREDCMHCEGELLQSATGVGQSDSNCCWTSSKRLHIGRVVNDRPGVREAELTNRWVSKVSTPRLYKYDRHAIRRYDDSHGAMENVEWRSRDQEFTSVSRCYPPNVQDRGAHLSHTSETRQAYSMKGNRASGLKVDCNQSARRKELLESKHEDLSFSNQDGSSEHSKLSGKLSLRKNRTKRNHGGIIRFLGNQDSKDDSIKRRYDDAAEYTAVDTSASKEGNCSNITLPHVRVSMDIDDDAAESEEIVSMALGAVSPAKKIDISNRMQKSEATSEKSTRRTTQGATASRSSPAVFVDVTNRFELHAHPGAKEEVQESDAHRLSQRQRQIEYGKNTLGYERYTELVLKPQRKVRDSQTPNPKQICSKRSWDGQIRKWRRLLHAYDPLSEDGEEIAEDLSVLKLQRGGVKEANSDAADDSPCPQRICDTMASRGSSPGEEKMGMEDGSLTIYDDWMEP